jgi:hypothetical protein
VEEEEEEGGGGRRRWRRRRWWWWDDDGHLFSMPNIQKMSIFFHKIRTDLQY